MDPIELPPAIPACCGSILASCSTTTPAERRVQSILCKMSSQQPGMFVNVTFWRPLDIPVGLYGDDTTRVWVKLYDNAEVLFFEEKNRFYQQNIGVIFDKRTDLWVPAYMELQPDDVAEFPHGESYMVTDALLQYGFKILTVSRPKSEFVKPPRTTPTYRTIGAGARIA